MKMRKNTNIQKLFQQYKNDQIKGDFTTKATSHNEELQWSLKEGWNIPTKHIQLQTTTNPCQTCESDQCDICPQKAKYANTNYFEHGFSTHGTPRNLNYETMKLKDHIITKCQLASHCKKRINGICTAESCRMQKIVVIK